MSAADTRRLDGAQRARVFDVGHACVRPRAASGVSHESVQSSTMRATASPKRARMSSRRGAAALIFGGVVQQRGDRLVLAAAVVEHDRRDAHEVAEVGRAGALARLRGVRLMGVAERLVEPVGQRRHAASRTILCQK